jgi:hypothetical protein
LHAAREGADLLGQAHRFKRTLGSRRDGGPRAGEFLAGERQLRRELFRDLRAEGACAGRLRRSAMMQSTKP